MEEITKYVILFFTLLAISACGNSSKRSYSENYSSDYDIYTDITYDEDDGKGGYDEDWDTDDEIHLTGIIETCNKCKGYGLVQKDLYSEPEICKFCWVSTWMRMQQGWIGFNGQYGQVDAVFNELPANYFDELEWNDGGSYNDNGRGNNTVQIESEIAQHEENIAQIEHQLEYIESSVNRTYLEQELIKERYEVKRLKNLLNR